MQETMGRNGGVEFGARGFVHLRETIYPGRLRPTWINGLIDVRIKVTFFLKVPA